MYVRILCVGATLDPTLWKIPNKGLSLARALSLSPATGLRIPNHGRRSAAPERERGLNRFKFDAPWLNRRNSIITIAEGGDGVRSGPGAARTILLFHIICAWPCKQPRVVSTFLKV